MSTCGVCLKNFTPKQGKVSCVECKVQFHGPCVGMTKLEIDELKRDENIWRCKPCAEERRKSKILEAKVDGDMLTLNDIMIALQELKNENRKSSQDFNEAYEVLNVKMEENTAALKEQTTKVDEYMKIVQELKAENKSLKQQVLFLEERLVEVEQYSRRNAVEIYGVPEGKNEDTLETVKKVGVALNMIIENDMVDACHRLYKKPGTEGPAGIIVKFVRRVNKEEMIRKRKVKRDLSTRHLDLPMDKQIYINESLCPTKRRLLALARVKKKDLGYAFLWVRNGKILMRKKEGERVKEIVSQQDLQGL